MLDVSRSDLTAGVAGSGTKGPRPHGDARVRLPEGPLALGDAAGGVGDGRGAAKILAILEAMHEITEEPRYRPSPWRTRRARLGVSLLTPE